MPKKENRKSAEDVRNESNVAKEKRRLHKEKVAAYDAQYKAAALARREKGETPAPTAPAADAPVNL